MNRTWVYWSNRFDALNVGYTDSIYHLSADELEALVKELEAAQQAGDLDLETDSGVENLRRIMEKHGA
jgi:hypothetical protein